MAKYRIGEVVGVKGGLDLRSTVLCPAKIVNIKDGWLYTVRFAAGNTAQLGAAYLRPGTDRLIHEYREMQSARKGGTP